MLYRINAQAEALEEELQLLGVPYQVRDPEGRAERPGPSAEPLPDAVMLSTMHSAKGLEWESVAVIGLSEGLMPFALATTPAALAEEKRLLYVALTRARTGLRLSWARGGASGRGNRGPSRYLRRAGLAGEPSEASTGRSSRRQPRTRALPSCRVCGEPLRRPQRSSWDATPAARLTTTKGCSTRYGVGAGRPRRPYRCRPSWSSQTPRCVPLPSSAQPTAPASCASRASGWRRLTGTAKRSSI